MDIPEKVNKAMDGSDAVNKSDSPTTVKAVSPMFNEYFFPGGGIWKPMSVKALTLDEATELHKLKREAVNQADDSAKVGDSKENNNT